MDDSLENKFRLAATVAPLDRRMKRKHLAVYGFILDWYHRKYGDALASVRHIVAQLKERDPDGVGLYMGDVHSALADLVSWGYLTHEKGAGRRASRYMPIWAHGRSVHKTPNTTENEISVRENQNTSVRETPNANGGSVHKTPNEDPLTVTRSLDPGTQIEGYDCAPASPPPTVGPDGATAAGGAQGFEELWRAYGYRQKKADAKAAYKKIAPDADLHERLVVAARAWQASWAAQGKDDAPRFSLAKWLEREEFECDPPTAYRPKERKSPAAKTPTATSDKTEQPMHDFTVYPDQTASGVIEKTELWTDDEDGAKMLTVWFRTTDGADVEHMIIVESPDFKEQDRGQREVQKLLQAAGLDELDQPDELLGRRVDLMINHRGGFVSCSRPWVPAPREPRNVPRFTDIVNRTPLQGWSSMIGTAVDDEDPEMEAA